MKINIIDPSNDSRWDQFVASQTESTVFHTSAWARTIKEAYKYKPRYYVLENGSGQLTAAIPTYLVRSWLTGDRIICLPFSDFCYPLGNQAANITLLLNAVSNEVKSGLASYLEIRGWHSETTGEPANLKTHLCNFRHFLDLEPGVEFLKTRFHHSVSRGIHQAVKRGLTCRITHSATDLEHFYQLNVATRKKLGVLPQPHGFFKALYRNMISQNLGFIGLAEFERKIIAGVIFLIHKDTIYYKFNASHHNYLRKRPNHLIIWSAIQYACANRYRYLDFGRCPFEENGLRIFKSRWGAQEIDLPYYYYPEAKGLSIISESSPIYRLMKLFSYTMPKFVFKTTGSMLYKHLA